MVDQHSTVCVHVETNREPNAGTEKLTKRLKDQLPHVHYQGDHTAHSAADRPGERQELTLSPSASQYN